MKSKTFIKTTISLLLIGLVMITGIQIAVDPLFQYHTPWFEMKPMITNERYQYGGLVKNFPYENVILGNSFSENFKSSSVTKQFGGETIKAAISGSGPEDWHKMLTILKNRSEQPKYIIFNLDPYSLLTPKPEKSSALATSYYLYDYNLVNDVNYMFNFDILTMAYDSVYNNINGTVPDMDTVFLDYGAGKQGVIDYYKSIRPEPSDEQPDVNGARAIAQWNLDFIRDDIAEMRDTQFYIYFSPIGILYWDKIIRENNLACWREVYHLVCDTFQSYSNVHLFLWSDDEMLSVMSDVDQYKDEAHYNPDVCDFITERMGAGEGLVTVDNAAAKIKKLFDYVQAFDYESILGDTAI